MNFITKKIVYLCTFLMLISLSNHLMADLNWMPSNYWFGGHMRINGDPDLTYNICHWNNSTQKMELSPVTFETNTDIDIAALVGGPNACMNNNLEQSDQGCMLMGWTGSRGTGFILVPSLPFTDYAHPENEPAFQNDLKAGKLAPYFVIERIAGIITIYVLGPTLVSKYAAQKLTFNFLPFEQMWVHPSWWYNGLSHHAKGMFFAFSYDINTISFLNSPGRQLSNDAFYIADPTASKNWIGQYTQPNKLMSMSTLQEQGIIQYQGPFIDLDDLQGVINFINWTGQGNFESVK